MKYYYFPTTTYRYIGMGFGGSAYGSNGGYLVGCGRGGNIEEITNVMPEEIIKKANFIEQAALAKSESKDGPTQITKKRYDLWKWLGDGKEIAKEWFINNYNRFKSSRLNQWRLKKQEAGKKWLTGKYNAWKEWFKDKYDRFRNFKSSRLNRIQLWGLDKKEKFNKKMEEFSAYVRRSKYLAKASLKTLKNVILEKLRKLGINVYAYGRATAEVLGEAIINAAKLAYQIIKDAASGAFTLTSEMIVAIGKAMKETGWSALEVATATNLLRNPYTFKQQMALKAMDWVPTLADVAMSGVKTWMGMPSFPTTLLKAKGWGAGVFNMGAGMKRKRRGRFVKGSPEAKAYMRHLRSMRRR